MDFPTFKSARSANLKSRSLATDGYERAEDMMYIDSSLVYYVENFICRSRGNKFMRWRFEMLGHNNCALASSWKFILCNRKDS